MVECITYIDSIYLYKRGVHTLHTFRSYLAAFNGIQIRYRWRMSRTNLALITYKLSADSQNRFSRYNDLCTKLFMFKTQKIKNNNY